jgi:hypothetical protein
MSNHVVDVNATSASIEVQVYALSPAAFAPGELP